MPQFMVAIHHPDDFEPFSDSAETTRDIDALNDEMNAARVIVFVGGMQPIGTAKSIRVRDGRPVVTDGPYLETKEHIGGFWVLDVASRDEAVEWGKKAAIACRTPVEVRGFFSSAEARAGRADT
jgi:hypothetical protein